MNSQSPHSRSSKIRWSWIWLSILSVLLLVGMAALGRYITRFSPAFYRTAPAASSAAWTTFPTPVSTTSNWKTFANGNRVNRVVGFNGWIWVATDGGLIVQDPADGSQVQFTVDHGLPANRLSDIAIDRTGIIWVATESDGIVRYDGRLWERFQVDAGLPSNEISALVVDASGVLWAGTGAGIARFDGSEWQLVRFSLFSFESPPIRDLIATPAGVWAATGEGVWFFDGEGWTRFGLQDGLINEDVLTLAATPDGRVWAGTPSGIGVLDRGRWDRFTVRDGLLDAPIERIAARPDNQVWLGYPADAGPAVHLFDGLTATPVLLPNQEFAESLSMIGNELWIGSDQQLWRYRGSNDWANLPLPSLVPAEVSQIVEHQGEIWLAGDGQLSRWDGATWSTILGGEFSSMTSDPISGDLILAQARPSDGILRFDGESWTEEICRTAGPDLDRFVDGAVDSAGHVWIAGNRKLARYDGSEWSEIVYDWADDVQLRSIAIDGEDRLWAGTSLGLFEYDREAEFWFLTTSENVYWMTIDQSGALWYLTEAGVVHMVGDQPTYVGAPPLSQLSRGLVVNAEGVWVSSLEGVAQLQTDGNWRIHRLEDGLASNEASTLALGADGRVYAAFTTDRLGTSYYDPETDRWKTIFNIKDPNEPNGGHVNLNPRRDEVLGIAVTAEQDVLYGTFFGQVGLIGPDKLLTEPTDPLLFWDSVRDIVTDGEGGIWVIGWDGDLARYLPETEQWERYDRALAQSAVTSIVTDSDGRVWLGTDRGVAGLGVGGGCEFIPNRTEFNVIDGFWDPQSQSIWWLTTKSGVVALDSDSERLDVAVLSLSASRMTSAAVGRDQSIWFAEQNRVAKLNNTGLLEPISGADVGVTGEIQALTVDDGLRPWLGTPDGAWTNSQGRWERIGPEDGVADANVTDIWVAADGAIWFVTDGGVSVFRP